jgi:hypothetical protein
MLLGLIAAHAASPCTLSEGDFRDRVVDAVNRLERDDLEVTEKILDDLRRRMPCMTQPPDVDLLADLRVVQSVMAFADGRNWQGPLEAALRIRPTVDRIVGRAHPTYGWEPEQAVPEGRPLDVDHRVYVDGRPTTMLPATPGWYVVQKTDGESWNTVLYRGARPSVEWAEAPVERDPALDYEAWFGGTAGGVVAFQNTDVTYTAPPTPIPGVREESPGQRFPAYDSRPCPPAPDPCPFDRTWDPEGRGTYGVRAELRAWFYGPVGVLVSGDFAFGMGVPYRSGRVVLLRRLGRFRVGAGVAAFDSLLRRRSVAVEDGAEGEIPSADVRTTATSGLLALHVGWRLPIRGIEASLDLGGRPGSGLSAQGRVSRIWIGDGPIEPVLAGFFDVNLGAFVAAGAAAEAYAVRTRTAQIGLAFGGRFRGRL